MKILVTGANGFLASNIISELHARGHMVRAMVRQTADLSALQNLSYELFRGRIDNPEDVRQATRNCDVVIHAAADTSQHYLNYKPMMKANYLATLDLLEASRENNVKRFIFVSTANALGHGTLDKPGDETCPVRYPFSKSAYGISKSKAQELVQEYGISGKLDTVVVNPTFMIGPRDSKPASGKILLMMCGKKIVWLPSGGKNFVHVADAATAICNAIDKGKTGACYLLANENLTYSEFYEKVQKITNGQSLKIFLPGWFVTLMGALGNLVCYAGFRSDLNYINARILCTRNFYTGTRAVKELNMPQTSVDIAIRDAIAWFREKGYLRQSKL